MQLQLRLIHRLTEIKSNGLDNQIIGRMDTRNNFMVRDCSWTKNEVLLIFHWIGMLEP